MTRILPQNTDTLNSPSHSFLHRVISVDTSSPESSIDISSTGTVTVSVVDVSAIIKSGDLVIKGVPQAFAQPFTSNGITPDAFIYLDSTYSAFRFGINGGSSYDSIAFMMYNEDIMSLEDTKLHPSTANDDLVQLGTATQRWHELFVGTGASIFNGTLEIDGVLNLGHATDTTIQRVSAGVVSIEGNNIITANVLGTGAYATIANYAPLSTPTFTGNVLVTSANGLIWGVTGLTAGHTVNFQYGGDANNTIVSTYGAAAIFKNYHGTIFSNNTGIIARFGMLNTNLDSIFYGNLSINDKLKLYPVQLPNAPATTVMGYMLGVNSPSALCIEQVATDDILSLGINCPQVGTRDNAKGGGIFRFDTRAAYNKFVIVTYASGGATEAERFSINLDTGASLLLGNLTHIGSFNYGVDAQATDTYVVTLSPVPTALVAGMIVTFKANTANTTACTLNVNGLGAKAIIKRVSTALASGDILAGMTCMCVYDGTSFVLMNPVVN